MTKSETQAIKQFEDDIKKWFNTYFPEINVNRPDIERDIHRFAVYLKKNPSSIVKKGE